MAIVQQHILSPTAESFVLTFDNPNSNNLYITNVDVDSSGNIYAVMWDFDEANVIKLSQDGTIAWKKRITDVRDSNKWDSVRVDESSGDVYCVGSTYGNITSNQHLQLQLLVAKYNSSGVRQWAKIFGDMGRNSSCSGFTNYFYSEQENILGDIMSCDSNGITFRAFKEHACGPGFMDIMVSSFVEINSSGSLIRQRETSDFSTVSAPANCACTNYSDRLITYGVGVKSRTGSGHYAGGRYRGVSYHQESGDQWSCIAKFDSSGDLVWNKKFRYNNSGSAANTDGSRDAFQSISLDSNDNLYTISAAVQQGASPQNRNPLVMKINSSGTLQWIRRLASTTTGLSESYVNNIQVDPDNDDNIFVGSYIKVYGTHNWGTDTNLFALTKYNSSGTLQWQRLIGGFFISSGNMRVIDGFIYLCGGSTSTSGNTVILKIPKSGNLAGMITHDSNTFSVRNGNNTGNFNIYIDAGTSTGMSSTVNPSYAYYNNFTNRYTYNGNTAYANATNHNDGSAFGDSNSNIVSQKTSLGFYS